MSDELNTFESQPVATQQAYTIETASTAAAAMAKTAIEARYIVAMRQPRNWDSVRLKLLDSCRRSGFAETARYAKPIGNSRIEGPSIRFAEEAARCMGNLLIESPIIHEDQRQRIIRVTVTDLEGNLTYPTDIIVSKQVERSTVKQGQKVLGQRLNSYGKPVYIVEATEDDLLVKAAAQVSKAMRTNVLRILPGDILEEAMDLVSKTLKSNDEKDPSSSRKKLCDAFYNFGVKPEDLAEFLNHPLEQSTPTELTELRQVYAAMKEGETTWFKVMEPIRENRNQKEKPKQEPKSNSNSEPEIVQATTAPTPETKPQTSRTADLKNRL